MESLFPLVFWGLLFRMLSVVAPQHTYEWKDPQSQEKLVCQKCPPGTSVAEHCTKDKPTVCKDCPDRYYTQYWNYLDRCLYCNVFCNAMEEEVVACNRTHNRVCQCKPGYHTEWYFCIEHSKCPPGSGVIRAGSSQEDTKCAPCPEGTFSSLRSIKDACRPHQNCAATGLRVSVNGSRFHDTFCTTCKHSQEAGLSDPAEDGSGNPDCQEAAIDFVPFEIKSPRRLRRLQRILRKSPPGTEPKRSAEELQVDLHSYLVQLKDSLGKEQVWSRLQVALKKMNLQNILQKIHALFSLDI